MLSSRLMESMQFPNWNLLLSITSSIEMAMLLIAKLGGFNGAVVVELQAGGLWQTVVVM